MSKDKDSNFGKYKYANGKIYKLCCKDPTITEIYVGSTLNQYKRKNSHKAVCNNPNNRNYNLYVYQFIRENGGFDNWNIVILEEYPTENKNELVWKEREWIEQLKPVLNSCSRPIITLEQRREYLKKYYEENSEQRRETSKKYYEENKEKVSENQKKYREENSEQRREKNKKWREENSEQIREKGRKYRENNKEEIRQKVSEKNKERVKCDICKKDFARGSLTAHKKRFHST